jgi:osmotically-inducible protein OsmY
MNRLLYLALAGLAISQLQGCAAVAVGGAAVGASMATDRRTTGAYVGDQEIELRAMKDLGDALPDKNKYIAVTSFNRQVLLTGQVPDEATKAKATEVVKTVPEVRTVFNELAVSGVVSFTSYTSDSTITAKVKSRLWDDDKAPGTKIKVKTESGVVYLMGLLTRAEAAAAAEVARTTAGVTKVVTLFEYID